jgi:hypothetical protein
MNFYSQILFLYEFLIFYEILIFTRITHKNEKIKLIISKTVN